LSAVRSDAASLWGHDAKAIKLPVIVLCVLDPEGHTDIEPSTDFGHDSGGIVPWLGSHYAYQNGPSWTRLAQAA